MELFSLGHLVVLAVVAAFLFFGWKQLPDMARSLGRSLRVFKTEIKGMSEDEKARAEARDAHNEPAAIESPKVVRVRAEPRQPVSASPQSRPRPAPRPDSVASPDRPASPS